MMQAESQTNAWNDGFEQRREARHRVSLTAQLRYFREQSDVRVLDLSSGGAMIEADAPPARGEEVVLVRGAVQVVATVAWVKEHHCGLCFHRAVDKRALMAPLAAA
ncbi:MAG: PilZ domain-containing protein [Sphingomonadaceae bacterium]|nr:PilZ domain-containing protein [Sphingomonadaceae bacterium]